MTWRQYLLLFVLGIAMACTAAIFEATPGYMDADYYYAGGIQLAGGRGFSEPYLWNYLDDPAGLPHPSHAYWMPLASILAAAGMVLSGSSSWLSSRLVFILFSAVIPPLTGGLAWSFTARRDLALTSGLLAAFPVFYLPFFPVTDTFGLYMVFGGAFFLLLHQKPSVRLAFLCGILAGLMHLTRTDGLIWLLTAFLAVIWFIPLPTKGKYLIIIKYCFFLLAGYLLIMTPWFLRNHNVFGALLAPGGSKMLWLTSYDQMFSYPAGQITFERWWQSGLQAILRVRTWALALNLSTLLAVQGEVFLLPLVILGAWVKRKDIRVQTACLAYLLTLALMTIVFPFAGARGGFFHAGAALQMVWWALAPIGLERLIAWGNRVRGWNVAQAGRVFRAGLILCAALATAIIFSIRILGEPTGNSWNQEQLAYRQVEQELTARGMDGTDVVMTANPPGFYLASGNPGIALPDGDKDTLLNAASRYDAKYVILEEGSTPGGLLPLYFHPANQAGLIYLGNIAGIQLYEIQN